MKKTVLALLATLSLGVSLPASAQEYMFTYSKLYTQLKNNTKEGGTMMSKLRSSLLTNKHRKPATSAKLDGERRALRRVKSVSCE